MFAVHCHISSTERHTTIGTVMNVISMAWLSNVHTFRTTLVAMATSQQPYQTRTHCIPRLLRILRLDGQRRGQETCLSHSDESQLDRCTLASCRLQDRRFFRCTTDTETACDRPLL